MRCHLIAVGRARSGAGQDLFRDYAARLNPPLQLSEVEVRGSYPPPEQRRREAALLLAALPERATIVALDERGIVLTSGDFAARLGRWRDAGVADLALLIGGADGHDETVRARADLVLSLGAMTWPHLLVRALVAEQLYRAQQILANHPYHRG